MDSVGEWNDSQEPSGQVSRDVQDVISAARNVANAAWRNAADDDRDGAFPVADIKQLHEAGLLHAPFPPTMGGAGLGIGKGAIALQEVLVALGRGSLALGRLYEGHVNAVVLVSRYGSQANLKLLLREAEAGRPTGVWMAGPPLRLETDADGRILRGDKLLASGSGHFRRPLVAADDDDGNSIMLLPDVGDATRADSSLWQAHGMRATATGTVNFTGLRIHDGEIVGKPGDYLRPPYFRGGAWRVIAVQFGGLLTILDQYRQQLAESAHAGHPVQLARFGEALVDCETARLWVQQACRTAEGPFDKAEAVDAYVDLARNAFEATALRVIAHAQKAIGLKAFLRPNPLERVIRDLTTYLRQPALDASLISAAAYHLRDAR